MQYRRRGGMGDERTRKIRMWEDAGKKYYFLSVEKKWKTGRVKERKNIMRKN